jgi:hypothetical protein
LYKGLKMANTYTWSVKKMTAHAKEGNFENIIHSVEWDCSATDDVDTVATSGTQAIEFNAGSSFTPSNQLTEQLVVGWVKTAMGQQTVSAVQSQLDAQLQEVKTPETVNIALPWAA